MGFGNNGITEGQKRGKQEDNKGTPQESIRKVECGCACMCMEGEACTLFTIKDVKPIVLLVCAVKTFLKSPNNCIDD